MNIFYPTDLLQRKSFMIVGNVFKNLEMLLLSLLAVIGIAGSLFLISSKSDYLSGGNMMSPGSAAVIAAEADENKKMAEDFNDYVKMPSKGVAGEEILIEFLADEKASRYVMDMGNGVRLIVTQKNLMFVYDTPGKYTIELKKIDKGLLHLVGTKTIKIK